MRVHAQDFRSWRGIAIGAAIGAFALGARCARERHAAPDRAPSTRLVEVHVKFRSAGHGALGTPLFTHLPARAHDARERWVREQVAFAAASSELARLAADPEVEQAFVAPEVDLAHLPTPLVGEDCPIATPSFESYQGYLGPAPAGIDAPAAWRKGARGAGVAFADIEGNWNARHEDLPGDRIRHAGGERIDDSLWRAHGTAVLGEVVGRDNGKGVVGIAPDVDRVITSSIGDTSVADAIDTAAEQLGAGDVLLIELQGGGPRGRFLPVEYWDDAFDAISAATDRGIVVVEAAGNGGEDLDHRAYGGKLDRKRRDSGAIVVGAGGPPRAGFTDRARLDFSNYGSRVDVQGWGRRVATLDYGDLQQCAGVDRHYTDLFSGTSSASPIVAGAAILLESYTRARGVTLAPREVRRVLGETGTPQTGDTGKHIGPRPDLDRALRGRARELELPRRDLPASCLDEPRD